jgi:hypothetical protein
MNARRKLCQASNFALYYGVDRAEELSSFDVAIVEPKGQKPESIKALHEKGILVVSYLSAMEIHPSFAEYKLLDEEDFLKVNGKPLINKAYGTYIADLRSRRWNDMVYHAAGRLIYHSGFDGVFLDTIGDVEMPEIPEECREAQILSAVGMIARIRKLSDDCVIIQNNGLERLCEQTAEIIDGICWENPPFGRQESLEWTEAMLRKLKGLREKSGITVFLLVEDDEIEIAKKIARENNYLLYNAPTGYIKGVNSPDFR